MNLLSSALTPGEAYRLHGTVSAAQLEALVAKSEQLEAITPALLGDGANCFPDEDFLEPILAMARALRGSGPLLEALEDLQMQTYRTSEYGRYELNKAQQALDALK